ncbi:alanine aminotransferase, partial [Musa troglodytarum]
MVGSGVGGDSRSKEAVGMLALHEALRNVCLNSDWTYSVFWTIRPRPMLMWEDGFCRTRVDDIDGEDQVRKAFSKMSIQLYNYGEGNSSPSPSAPVKQIPARPPPPVFNWSHPSLASNPPIASPAYHPSAQMGLPSNKDDTQLYLLPPSSEAQMDEMMPEQESDLKWPNGLSFFTALTGRTDDAKLLFGAEMLGHQPPPHPHPLMAARKNLTASSPVSICGNADELKAIEASGLPGQGNIGDSGTALSASNTEDLLSLESHSGRARKMENSKFKRSFTLPARMTTSSSSSSLDHHHASTPQPMDYRGSEA